MPQIIISLDLVNRQIVPRRTSLACPRELYVYPFKLEAWVYMHVRYLFSGLISVHCTKYDILLEIAGLVKNVGNC